VLSARTQDVVLQASGPAVKVPVGSGGGQLAPGKRYLVNLVVTSRAGDQVATARQQVSSLLDVPDC
jgi:hypothetical protein